MNARQKQKLKLMIVVLSVATVWLVALPWLARQPMEQAGWETLREAHIDPSAMYYTELEAMKPILQKLNQ